MTSYFNRFPSIPIVINKGRSDQKVVFMTDLFRRVVMDQNILRNNSAFYKYTILDGERPEDVAMKVYGSEEYYWVILITNNITDMTSGWAMSANEFRAYLDKKYPNYTMRLTPSTSCLLYDTNPFPTGGIPEITYNNATMPVTNGTSSATPVYAHILDDGKCAVFVNNVTGGTLTGANLVQGTSQFTTSTQASRVWHCGNFQPGDILTHVPTGKQITVIRYNANNQHIVINGIDAQKLSRYSFPTESLLVSNRLNSDGTPVLAVLQRDLSQTPTIRREEDSPIYYLTRQVGGMQFNINRATAAPYDASRPFDTTTDIYVASTGSGPITFREWEQAENDKKQSILILNNQYLDTFIKDFTRSLNNSVGGA